MSLFKRKQLKKYFYSMCIQLRNKPDLWYTATFNRKPKTGIIKWFYDFYHWFYIRKSDHFTKGHSSGYDIILRSEIVLVRFSEGWANGTN